MAITFGPGVVLSNGGVNAGAPLLPPTVTGVVVSGTTATVSFSAPTLAGNPAVDYYVVTSTPGNLSATGQSSPIVVSGLSTGVSYTFSVTAYHKLNFGPSQSGAGNYLPSTGGMYSWGLNTYGILGLGNRTNYSSPVQVGALTNWNVISIGGGATAAIKTDGTLWTWGGNSAGGLGLGNITYYSSPKQVGALTNWKVVVVGGGAMSAIKTDGTLWSWGSNWFGPLGLGNITYYSSPRQVGALTNWLNISAGDYRSRLAVKTDGTLWSWGRNYQGLLGLGNTTDYSSPRQVGALTNWSSNISLGPFGSLAVKSDGTLWGWGLNNNGMLGFGNQTAYSSPKQVGALTNWASASPGAASALAVKTDGTLWALGGANGVGSLGLGTASNQTSPNQIGALTNWKAVASNGQYGSFALKTNGTLWAWGYNNNGQLGLGTTTPLANPQISSPVQIGGLTSWLSVSAGSYATLANTVSVSAPLAPTIGTATATGSTTAAVTYTAAATGSTATSFVAVSTPGGITATTTSTTTVTVSGLSAGTAYTFQVYGSNSAGSGIWSAASNGITTSKPTYGSLWVWGYNINGQLGLGNTTYYSSPVQVGALTSWASVAVAGFSVSLKTDGTLWAWGYNGQGQLGLGTTNNYSSPVQVGVLTNWKTFNNSGDYILAIKTDGTLWGWGRNVLGNLGLGNTSYYSSPKQVGALTNWSKISSYGQASIAIKTNGTLWVWGRNTNGQLGLGNTTNYSSPVQMGALTNWASVTIGQGGSTIAIKTDGTLWSWGQNNYGQLGLGNLTYYSSPQQIGALTNWKQACAGLQSISAIKTDGSLWSWGRNNLGQLGLNSQTASYLSPVQVGGLTNWSNVSILYFNTIALKTDGTLWSWGSNKRGGLGLGNTIYYSSPKQIGALTTWLSISGGAYNGSAIRS